MQGWDDIKSGTAIKNQQYVHGTKTCGRGNKSDGKIRN